MIYAHFPMSNDFTYEHGITAEQAESLSKEIVMRDIDRMTDTSWSNGSDSDIVRLVDYARKGYIDLSDYWDLGEERMVTLLTGEDVCFVLMNQGGYTLVTPAKNTDGSTRTTCSFVVGLKHCLAEPIVAMEGTSGAPYTYSISNIRNYCNGDFYDAIPSNLKFIFAQFETKTNWKNSYGEVETQSAQDYFTLPVEKEVFGTDSESVPTGNLATQFWYYQTGAGASNKKKVQGGAGALLPSGDGNAYWLRSSVNSNSTSLVNIVTKEGTISQADRTDSNGIAPFGCIN